VPMLICTRGEKQRGPCVSWTLAVHAHRRPRLLHRLEPATLVGMRWQDCVMWDLVISRRLWMPLAIFTNDNGSTPTPTTSLHWATSGQPWPSSAMAPTAYTNDVATSRRRAQTLFITAPHLHRQLCRIEKTSLDIIMDVSVSTPTTHAIRH
jgi:hypothetical protein